MTSEQIFALVERSIPYLLLIIFAWINGRNLVTGAQADTQTKFNLMAVEFKKEIGELKVRIDQLEKDLLIAIRAKDALEAKNVILEEENTDLKEQEK